jgi:Domain of unknown function (DUF4281)
MPWETIFTVASFWPLLFWLLLAFGPRNEATARIVLFGGIAPLALVYAVLLPMIMAGAIDAVGPNGNSTPDMTQLSGVMALFDSKGGATIGWIHYLAFDLFVGLWVARNADRHGYPRWAQVPILFFTLMAGPLGLTLYLLLRLTCKNPPENAAAPS